MSKKILETVSTIPLWLKVFILIFVMATLLVAMVYATVQQTYRSAANDPQIEIAEDVANALSKGADPQALIPPNPLDISGSLAPFIIVYNASGTPVASSAQLNGKNPVPPQGVFDFLKYNSQDRFTWQPAAGVRVATVIAKYDGPAPGFILAGRSLREVEIREAKLGKMLGAGWLISLLAGLLAAWLLFGNSKHYGHQPHQEPQTPEAT